MHCLICSFYKETKTFRVKECGAKESTKTPHEGVTINNSWLIMPYDLTTKAKRPNWCPHNKKWG